MRSDKLGGDESVPSSATTLDLAQQETLEYEQLEYELEGKECLLHARGQQFRVH